MRNFWCEVEVDGRKTDMAGGPRSREEGLKITLYQRKNGEKVKAMTVTCVTSGDILMTVVEVGGERYRFETER